MSKRPKRVTTMDEIARLAKVSKPTVSRALSNSPLVKPETRDHILSVAREHGYAVNRNAQKLRNKRTNTIAVSLDYRSHQQNHITDPFIYELLAGVSEALGDCSQDLLLCAPSHNDLQSFNQILSARGADGFIVLGQGHRDAMLSELALSGAPLVVWGAGTEETAYCVVGSDNFRGGALAARYFLERKRRRFLFVGDTSFPEIRLRHEGFRQTARDSGLDIEHAEILSGNFSFEAAHTGARRFLSEVREMPDAVFTFSDTAAMAFIRAFREIGVSIPEEVSIVGYNDIPSAAYFHPAVSTIRQDIHQAGRLLVDNLMQMLEGRPVKSSIIKTELIIRET